MIGKKHKVGDKVRVRPDLKQGWSYGENTATQGMQDLAGQIVTLTTKYKSNCMHVQEDPKDWNWTPEMFVEIEEVIESYPIY